MNTEDHDYDDVRQKAALGLLGLSPTNIYPPSTPFGISGLPAAPGSLSSSTPNRSPLVGSSTAPRRRTPIESQNTSSLSAGATSRTVGSLGRPVEDEGYSGQPTSPIIPLKRKHLSSANEANSSQPPNPSSSQTQGRRRGAGSGGRGSGGRGRGRGSSTNAGVNGRHTSDGQHSNSGTGSVSSTRFDPVAHARRTNDRDAARDIDSLSITTHTATPDRDQDMPGTGGSGQRDHDADVNADSDVDPESADAIRCICGFSNDDGWSIGCDGCGRWCHGVCFGIDEKDKENLPERWECWECNVNLKVDRELAVRLQKARLNLGSSGKSHSNGDADADADKGNSRRRTSPGVERKPRKSSAGTGTVENGHKRRRRSSIMTSPVDRLHALPNSHHSDHPPHSANGIVPPGTATAVNGPPTNGVGEDTFVDIDEPWTHAYNDIAHDIVPHQETRDKLRRQAAQWRGVTAISPVTDSQVPDTPIDYFQQHPFNATGQQYPPANSPVAIHPLHPILNQSTPSNLPAHLLRPPTYALHTTSPIPCSSLITPFPSTITSSATYLADPLNAYAHLGMPKPYVHLIGPPLDVALDARVAGGKARWARSGCRPNAVVRPVVCDISNLEKSKRKGKEDRDRKERGKSHKAKNDGSNDTDPQTVAFGIFALRDLKADEEVVLGWEWDDGNVVHLLPALLKEEGAFPPADLHNFRMQMSNILHTLTSTYATCACGAHTQDCAIKRMAEFVERGERLEEEAAQREKELRERDLKDGDRRRRVDKDEVIRLHSPWTPGAPPTPFSAMPTPKLPWDAFSGPARPSSAPQTSTPASAGSSTFTLPHERHQGIAVSEGDKELTSRRDKGPIDLGPLIGAARGFKTRERIPGSGGLSGVEMVPRQDEAIAGPSSLRVNTEVNIARPSSVPAMSNSMHIPHFLVSPASPSPNHGRHVILHGHEGARSANPGETSLPRLGYGIKKRSNIWGDAKGKGKAVEFEEPEVEVNVVEDEDIDMNAIDGSGGAHKGSTSHPRSRKPLSRNKNKEKDKSQSLSPISLSTSLHPPDPGTSRLESETLSLSIPEEKMPPKMRKRWIHKEAEALLAKDVSKSVSKSSSIGNREKGMVEAKKKGKDRAITGSSGEAMDVDEESPRIRAGDGNSHSITADPPARTSPSTPFARLSLQSPAEPASSSSSHPVSTVSQSHSESFERDTHSPNSPPISSESAVLSPPSRTSSSFLARVLNSPEHSWVPFRWEQSDKPEASTNDIPRSADETPNLSTGEDNTMDEAAVSKEIKKEALEGMEHQDHSTEGEDVIMEGPEQDELLPTPSPPPSPSLSRMIEDESRERVDTKTDSEARRSDSVSSGTSTPRQSAEPVVEGDLVKLSEARQALSLPEEIVSSATETQDQTDRQTSAGPETNCSPALPAHQSALPSPTQHSMPLSSPLSSPVSSPFEPTVTMDVLVQPSDSVSARQYDHGAHSTSSDVVPELVPSTSISPIQSVRDVPPATPPSVLSSLSPFSSPVPVNGRDEDVKSSRGSPVQDDSLAVLDSKTVSPEGRSPPPDPEVNKDLAEFPDDVAGSPQEAPSTPAAPSSNANIEIPTEENPSTEPPPQPAPSKVKLSLKDFALRKKRMREEEEKERAEKAKVVPSTPVREAPAQETEAERSLNTVNGEVDAVEQKKQEVIVEPAKEETKSLTSTEKPESSVEGADMKVEEISVRSDPIIAPVSTAINGDAKGRPHSPSLAPLPMNISLSSLPALTLPPVVSNPAMGSPTPDILNPSLSRKATQQEEGEIDDVPAPSSALLPRANALPPKPPTPVLSKHKFADSSLPPNPALQHLPQNPTKSAIPPFRQTLKHGAESAETRSRTPPTQPRSFTGYGGQYTARSPHTHTSPIPTTPRVLASVTAPTAVTNISNTANPIGATPLSAIGRPPPSGPRALRQQQQNVGTGRPIHSIPRGPSHERDRDGRDWPHRYRR